MSYITNNVCVGLHLLRITPNTFIRHHWFQQEMSKGQPIISPLSTSEIELYQRLFLCWCVKKKILSLRAGPSAKKLTCTVHTHWTQLWRAAAASVQEVKKQSRTLKTHTHTSYMHASGKSENWSVLRKIKYDTLLSLSPTQSHSHGFPTQVVSLTHAHSLIGVSRQ